MKTSLKIVLIIIALFISVILFGVYNLYRIAPQGHGSQANYLFNESKFELEKRIDSIIKNDPALRRKEMDPSPEDNYYNKGAYFTIIIDSTSFCLRYYGDSTHWSNSSKSSEIFIASMRSLRNTKMKKEEYLNIIENNFINKLKNNR